MAQKSWIKLRLTVDLLGTIKYDLLASHDGTTGILQKNPTWRHQGQNPSAPTAEINSQKYNLAPLPHIPHTPYVSYTILERSIHTDFHYPHKLHAQNTKYGHKMRVLRGFKLLALALHTGTGAPMRTQLKSHVTQYGSAHEKRSKYTSQNEDKLIIQSNTEDRCQ